MTLPSPGAPHPEVLSLLEPCWQSVAGRSALVPLRAPTSEAPPCCCCHLGHTYVHVERVALDPCFPGVFHSLALPSSWALKLTSPSSIPFATYHLRPRCLFSSAPSLFCCGQTELRLHQFCTCIPGNQGVVPYFKTSRALMVKLQNFQILLSISQGLQLSHLGLLRRFSMWDFFGLFLLIIALVFLVCHTCIGLGSPMPG